jgi:hypothetical protein
VTGLSALAVALLAAMVASELSLRGTKLQTGLARALAAWGGVWLAALYPVVRLGDVELLAFTVFWGGAFLSWFGIRSHIESSILLRMLYFLRRRPLSAAEVLETYLAHCGPGARIQELLRGGLARAEADRAFVVTSKGKTILAVVARLR